MRTVGSSAFFCRNEIRHDSTLANRETPENLQILDCASPEREM